MATDVRNAVVKRYRDTAEHWNLPNGEDICFPQNFLDHESMEGVKQSLLLPNWIRAQFVKVQSDPDFFYECLTQFVKNNLVWVTDEQPYFISFLDRGGTETSQNQEKIKAKL